MIRCKDSVRFKVLRPEIYRLFPTLDDIFASYGVDCVITSANDSMHKQGSLHYQDKAIDLRSKHLKPDQKELALGELRGLCGEKYDVLLENAGKDNEHYHVEFDSEDEP